MERTLLALWHAVPSGNIKQAQLADQLGLSSKQTARLLRKWAEEGWFTFTAGRGRGNSSYIQWHMHVEELYEQQMVQLIKEKSIETASKYLLFDWSPVVKQRLLHLLRSNFGYVQNRVDQIDKLIIPRKYPILTLHPLYASDIHSANMVANVYSRLVTVDESGSVTPELAHSWDLTKNHVRLYLRKEIFFHDGSYLTAIDVANCLDRLRNDSSYADLWKPIESISTSGPHIIDISFPNGCSYCLQMLGMINASIYKETSQQTIGSGSFYVSENNEQKTTLHAFSNYFQQRPLIDVVEFIQVSGDFDVAYRSSCELTEETFQVESDSGFGVVIINAFKNSPIRNKEIRDYIHYAIAKHRHKIGQFHTRAIANHKSCLIGQEQHPFVLPPSNRPNFEHPLIIKAANYTDGATRWLKESLESEGIPIEIQWMSFKEKLTDVNADQKADLFVHGEVFEMNQNFSFFYFLANGNSPLATIMKSQPLFNNYLEQYATTPFEDWTALNLKVEQDLIASSIMLPLYYEKRHIPFSIDVMDLTLSHFGFVDFSKLWVRPFSQT
ncbi:ABC transporter, substrate-binding protein [Planococcus sp. PAMC 21323]|uniref:ABC transporter substrate-binding protein n=1 Tax=Planococcus sp. PAMC 21323 TaxID=1526927 RepID=UPI0005703012|nr:ABC transporter substrate-binding protein [Planococcus sp. PAMC 21323]AIY05498.1 ABC transporter, substrate-binding protein [Planococcus sp. PAMC 21323]